MVVVALGILSDLKDHRAESAPAPADCAKLFRVVVLLIDEIGPIKYFLCFLQADVFSFDGQSYFPTILNF